MPDFVATVKLIDMQPDYYVISLAWEQVTKLNSVPDSLAEEAANFLRMAVDSVEQPWESKAQDGSSEKCWEHDFLLPVHFHRRTSQEQHGDHDECHKPCIMSIAKPVSHRPFSAKNTTITTNKWKKWYYETKALS